MPKRSLPKRKPGSATGQFTIGKNFDAPLKDFSEYTKPKSGVKPTR